MIDIRDVNIVANSFDSIQIRESNVALKQENNALKWITIGFATVILIGVGCYVYSIFEEDSKKRREGSQN